MTEQKFINLHHHDEYSLRDGLGTVEQLVKVIKERGQTHCCVTNHGHLGGWVRQYAACKKAGIIPIFGVEAYTSETRKEDSENLFIEQKEEIEKLQAELSHLAHLGFDKPKSPTKKAFPDPEVYAAEKQKYQESKTIYDAAIAENKSQREALRTKIAELQTEVREGEKAEKERLKESRKSNHLILLARTQEGFRNIIRMNNDAVVNGFYGKPRVNREAMRKWGKGVIASTACYSGELPQYLLKGEMDKAEEFYNFLKECFDDVYIEMTLVEWTEQPKICDLLIPFAKKVGGKLLITLDSHYINKSDEDTQQLLLLMANKQTMKDKENNKAWAFESHNLYYRDYDQLAKMFEEGFDGGCYKNDVFTREIFEEACANSLKVVEQIEEIKLDDAVKLPKTCEDGDAELAKHAWEGLRKRGLADKPEYQKRLEYELDVIDRMGFADYFLIVEKIIKMAIEKYGVNSTGIGRGSGVGSLVNYCLEITDLDPIEHKLLFERFLDEGRAGVLACTFKV